MTTSQLFTALPANSSRLVADWGHLHFLQDYAWDMGIKGNPVALAAALRLSPVYVCYQAAEPMHFIGVFAQEGSFLGGFLHRPSQVGPAAHTLDAVDFAILLIESANPTGTVRIPATELELRRSLGQDTNPERREISAPGITLLPLFYKTFDALHTPLGIERGGVVGAKTAH